MSLKKLPDSEIERMIDLWKNEPVLWDVQCSRYANADDRKAAPMTVDNRNRLAPFSESLYTCLCFPHVEVRPLARCRRPADADVEISDAPRLYAYDAYGCCSKYSDILLRVSNTDSC